MGNILLWRDESYSHIKDTADSMDTFLLFDQTFGKLEESWTKSRYFDFKMIVADVSFFYRCNNSQTLKK